MTPCTTQSSVGGAMAMVDTTYGSLHYPVKCWWGNGNGGYNLWLLALPSQVLVGQWQWWIQLMTPCTTQSSVGGAMAMVDTTYGSLHYPVKCWWGNGNGGYNLWLLALPSQVLVGVDTMAMVDTTYGSLHYPVKCWWGNGNGGYNLWLLALPSQVLVGQWQWWIQLMTPCTTQSSVGRAMAMVDTTYDSLHYPVKCWWGNGNGGYNL